MIQKIKLYKMNLGLVRDVICKIYNKKQGKKKGYSAKIEILKASII